MQITLLSEGSLGEGDDVGRAEARRQSQARTRHALLPAATWCPGHVPVCLWATPDRAELEAGGSRGKLLHGGVSWAPAHSAHLLPAHLLGLTGCRCFRQ